MWLQHGLGELLDVGNIGTTSGKLVFGIFAALSEFERELISERTKAGLASARARGRKGGAPFIMTAGKVRLAMAAIGKPKNKVADSMPGTGSDPPDPLQTCKSGRQPPCVLC
jgi:Resolvase, N terminal domain